MTDLQARLFEVITRGDDAAVVGVLRGQPESARRAAAPAIAKAARKLATGTAVIASMTDDGLPLWNDVSWEDGDARVRMGRQGLVARLALPGLMSISEIRKGAAQLMVVDPSCDGTLSILVDRAPDWLADWAQVALERHDVRAWTSVRALIDAGLIAAPRTEEYLSAMLAAPSTWIPDRAPGAAHPLRSWRTARVMLDECPELLDDLSLLFEVEATTHSLTSVDGSHKLGWTDALVGLSSEGVIDRSWLLDGILVALANDWEPRRAAWFARLWKQLAPTPPERAQRAAELARLLAADGEPIVAFAVGEAHELSKAGAVDASLIPALVAPMRAAGKTTVTKTLALLAGLVRSDPGAAAAAAAAAAEGLGHPAADIQERVLDAIERWTPVPTDEVTAALTSLVPALAASQQARGRTLLAAARGITAADGDAATAGADGPSPSTPSGELLRDLALRTEHLPAFVRSALQIDDPSMPLPPAPVAGEPVLDPDEQLSPIETLDELLDELVAPLPNEIGTGYLSPDRDRVIDAVLRHCGSPELFDGDLAPVVGRLPHPQSFYLGALTVASAWHGDDVQPHDITGHSQAHYTRSRRIDLELSRARTGRAGPLLSCPTHHGGWIDPRVLVNRVQIAATSGPQRHDPGWPDDDPDLALALLRIAPEGHAAALTAAAGLLDRAGELVRCALGDAAPLDGQGAAVVAALAARGASDGPHVSFHRGERHPEYPGARIVDHLAIDDVPDLAIDMAHTDKNAEMDWFALAPRGPYEQVLAAVLNPDQNYHEGPFLGHVAGALWPARRDIGHALLAASGGSRKISDGLLTMLLRPSEPFTWNAALAVGRTLDSRSHEDALLAADAIIAATEDGRLDGPLLGTALRTLFQEGFLSAPRIGPRLETIAQTSPLHSAVVRDALEAVFTLDDLPRNPVALIALLDELCAQTSVGVRRAASRALLSTLKGPSKSAKAAKAALQRTGQPGDAETAAVLQARLYRAERWARLSDLNQPPAATANATTTTNAN